jgi:putative ATPase
MDLFDSAPLERNQAFAPLAFRMRPRTLDEIVGQKGIVGPGSILRKAIEEDRLHSFILYGPPGSGKTSIAGIIARMTRAWFERLEAVSGGVSDIRRIAADAADRIKFYRQPTILFVDEIHRFNKSQQDVLLPYVEQGILLLIGATTENPLYELNNALLSRLKLYLLEPLTEEDIRNIIRLAIEDKERGLGNLHISLDQESLDYISMASQGDARRALNILDTIVNSYLSDGHLDIKPDMVKKVTGRIPVQYDKKGDLHYNTISAFIKSIRGSDPDAALFWLAVMLEGGEDPKFIARRLLILAAEDIGLADPNALNIGCSTFNAVQYLGLPEARIVLAEASIYMATAPKSNSSITAIDQAIEIVRKQRNITVPAHICDSSHSGSRKMGMGKGYKYPHDYGGYVEQEYLPPNLQGIKLYNPGKEGYEKRIREFLVKIAGQ